MDVAKYVALLARGLFFAQPSELGDVWEGSWGVPDVRSFRESQIGADPAAIKSAWNQRCNDKTAAVNRYGVSCWHCSKRESAALWSLYFPRGFGVAIRTTVGHALRSLEASKRPIEAREVQYVDYDETRLGDDPLVLLSHKRASLHHEQELRFLVALRDDEYESIEDWRLILRDLSKRHMSASQIFGSVLIRSGPVPARVVTDPTLVRRATPSGVYLSVDLATLIQGVHLAPQAPLPVRHAVLGATEAFGLDRMLVRQPEADMIPPDILEFE